MNSSKQAPTIHAIGPKPTKDRRHIKKLGAYVVLGVLTIAAIFGTANFIQNETSLGDQGTVTQADPHPGLASYASVIGKIHVPGGQELKAQAGSQENQGLVWQSINDTPGAAYQLILSLDNQISTVIVAVSKGTYDKFCQKPNMKLHQSEYDKKQFGGYCGGIVNGTPEEQKSHVDRKVRIRYTMTGSDLRLNVVEFVDSKKLVHGFLDVLSMRSEFIKTAAAAPDPKFNQITLK